jgi:hypothetical protein
MIRMVQQPLDFSSSSSASASEAAPSFAGSVTWEEIACGQRKMSMHGRWLQKRNQTAPIVQGSSLENVSILLLTHRLGQHQCQLNYLVGEYSNVLKLQLRELSTKHFFSIMAFKKYLAANCKANWVTWPWRSEEAHCPVFM